MNSLVAVVGPTGIGKSQVAFRLAQIFNGEIVNGDSRQIYRDMDIGTAKPTSAVLNLIPHHLISIIDPDEDFSLAQYQELAYTAIREIQHRGRLPLLVGGSGQYIWSVLEDWQVPQVSPDPEFRQQLEERATSNRKEALYQELIRIDPAAAQRIDHRNIRRVIRALEVQKSTGLPFSKLQRKRGEQRFRSLIVGLTTDRAELYRRIDLRVDEMIRQGLVTEVDRLMNRGYSFKLSSMSSIGYNQIGSYLRGELSLDTAIERIKYETHRFVRHQYNWFRPKDDRIEWFDIQSEDLEAKITRRLTEFMNGEQDEVYQGAGSRQ